MYEIMLATIAMLIAGIFTIILHLIEGQWMTCYEFLILYFIIWIIYMVRKTDEV